MDRSSLASRVQVYITFALQYIPITYIYFWLLLNENPRRLVVGETTGPPNEQ